MLLIAFWRPMRRRLSLMIVALLVATVGTFSWLEYRQLANALVAAAGERAASVSTRLAATFAQSEGRLRLDKQRQIADSVFVRFLAQPDPQSERAARKALEEIRKAGSQTVLVELWDGHGTRLLTSAAANYQSGRLSTAPATGGFASGSPVGPFVSRGDTAFYEVRFPVLAAGGDTIGIVRQFQGLGDGQDGALVRHLIGADAVLLVGNVTGDLWTDIARRVPAPPGVHAVGIHRDATAQDGTRWVGATAAVGRVPWVVWVALPRHSVLAPARAVLGRLAVVAAIILAIGGFGASVIARHLTRPLADVTAAAEAIAAGDRSQRVLVTRQDEVGRLGAAFNLMTARVETTTADLQAQAVDLELRNQELIEALGEAQASEARFRSVVETATDAIMTSTAEGQILYWNAAAQQVYGYTAAEAIGAPLSMLIPDERRRAHVAEFGELAEGRAPQFGAGVLVRDARRKDGTVIPVELTVSRWESKGDTFITSVVRDISGRAALEARLAHQATHDSLTGLANRGRFRERVAAALARDSEQRDSVAVLFIDLDDFKAVNDTAGHAAGDRLLCAVAERLLAATRGTDTVARLGGDEFGVLLWHVEGTEDVDAIASRIVATVRRPVALGDREVAVSVSIGVGRAAADLGADALLQNADTALYAAKDAGKGTYAWFAPAMHDALVERAQIQGELGPALDRGEFWLAYQPIVALETKRIEGFEALVRWNHPQRGQLEPGAFIRAAEASGQIVQLGRRVLEDACRCVAAFPGTPYVSVNISGRQLEDPGLVNDVAGALSASGLDPQRLFLEITETVLMADTDGTLARLGALKALGVRLAIDDFGTGYSSLRYLQRFPVDVLKIDKSFVEHVDGDDHDAALVRTIVALGDMLGLATVAEGIESAAQRDHLSALGCVLGQGFYFARPLDGDAAAALLASENPARRPTPPVPSAALRNSMRVPHVGPPTRSSVATVKAPTR